MTEDKRIIAEAKAKYDRVQVEATAKRDRVIAEANAKRERVVAKAEAEYKRVIDPAYIEKITKTAVLARPGWSGTLVTQLLGGPDDRKKVSGSTRPLALYELERVQLAEASQEFSDAQSGLAKRKAASQK